MSKTRLQTPETHPDHPIVGHYFKAFGCLYFCDSKDESGFNMTPVLNEQNAWLPGRRNVSDMAINRTYWMVYQELEKHATLGLRISFHCQHPLTAEEREFLIAKYEE